MSESDLTLYQKFTAKRGFPGRRVELLLAQLGQIMAQTMGGAKNTKLSDFLFDPPQEPEAVPVLTIDEIRALHGFSPKKRKKHG